MRFARVGVIALALTTLGCSGDRVTGADAQAAFAAVSSQAPDLPAGALVFVDGVQIADRAGLRLEPGEIHSIEVVKGEAARALYGDAAARGVIHIWTTHAADSTRPSGR